MPAYTHMPSGLQPLGMCICIRQSTRARGITSYCYYDIQNIPVHILGIPSLPIIFDPLINLTINNYNFSMKCGTGSGKFNYTWEKKSGKIPLRAKGVDSSHLTIFNLRPEDTGEYRCTISNSTGRITSYYTKLIVTGNELRI